MIMKSIRRLSWMISGNRYKNSFSNENNHNLEHKNEKKNIILIYFNRECNLMLRKK